MLALAAPLGASPVPCSCRREMLREKSCSHSTYTLSSGKHPEHWQQLNEPDDGGHNASFICAGDMGICASRSPSPEAGGGR